MRIMQSKHEKCSIEMSMKIITITDHVLRLNNDIHHVKFIGEVIATYRSRVCACLSLRFWHRRGAAADPRRAGVSALGEHPSNGLP